MPEEKRTPENREGRVVYSRPHPESVENSGKGKRGALFAFKRRNLAPTLTPLIIGFALLVGLVLGLGSLSVRQLNRVSNDVLELETRHAAKLNTLFRLHEAVIKLNEEARAKDMASSRGGPKAPFDLPLRNARDELENVLPLFARLPLSQTPQGLALSQDIKAFIEITQDPARYSLEGFEKFHALDGEIDNLLRDANKEQETLSEERDSLERQATEEIKFLTWLAVLMGSAVAAGTIWEVQRRFRQMRRSLEETQRERQFSAQMLGGMVSAVAAIDGNDCIRSANAAFFEIFPEARIGSSVHEKFASPEAMRMLAVATATQVDRATYRGRWVLGDNSSDAPRTFDVYSSPLEIDEQHGQILTLVDVTEAAKAETELRRNESLTAVGQAAAQVAHEIKNPLGSIRLGVAMLRDMTQSQEAHSTIDLVERGIDHLNKLTVDVTQYSRQKQLSLSTVDLNALLDASLELVTEKIQEKQTPIEKHFSEAPLAGLLDADQMRQVFVNLLANAIDASEAQSPITITTERLPGEIGGNGDGSNGGGRSRQGTWARVIIADHGAGIAEEVRAHLFEPFFTTKKRGTGLGLAIVKKIVEQHGGRITVESTPKLGTRFYVDLPLRSEANSSVPEVK